MPISDRTPPTSVTEGPGALELFTDRHDALRRVAAHLHGTPQPQILFFHGEGGNGKSLLLRYIQRHCAKCLSDDNYAFIVALDDEEFRAHLRDAADATPVPTAVLGFAIACADLAPTDPFQGPLALRRQLGSQGLAFPLFDFAVTWYLHRTHQLSDQRLRDLFPAEELDALSALADVVTGTAAGSLASALFSLFNRRLKRRWTLYLQQRGLEEADIQHLQRLDPERELLPHLPTLLACDLNAAMAGPDAPPRVLLLFDTHEAFWNEQRALSPNQYFARDEWLRRLLRDLALEQGIVVVVAGRDEPRWHEAPINQFPIPARALDDVYAHNNRGNALQRRADLLAGLSEHAAALAAYEQAEAAYGAARAPDDVYAHNNRGEALAKKAALLIQLMQLEEALDAFEAALAAWQRSLQIAPAQQKVEGVLRQLSEVVAALRARRNDQDE